MKILDDITYYTVSEVAAEAGVSGSTVRRYIREGTLPSILLANRRLVAVEDVADLIAHRDAVLHR